MHEVLSKPFSFVQGSPPKGLCFSLVSFLFLSFLACLEEGIASLCFRLRCYEGGGWALVSGGLDFSHEGVKRVVGLLVGFVFAIARAACSFLYLTNEYMITKKKKKKKEKKRRKKQPRDRHEPSPLHLRRLRSQHHEKSSALSPTHLSSPTMATA